MFINYAKMIRIFTDLHKCSRLLLQTNFPTIGKGGFPIKLLINPGKKRKKENKKYSNFQIFPPFPIESLKTKMYTNNHGNKVLLCGKRAEI